MLDCTWSNIYVFLRYKSLKIGIFGFILRINNSQFIVLINLNSLKSNIFKHSQKSDFKKIYKNSSSSYTDNNKNLTITIQKVYFWYFVLAIWARLFLNPNLSFFLSFFMSIYFSGFRKAFSMKRSQSLGGILLETAS